MSTLGRRVLEAACELSSSRRRNSPRTPSLNVESKDPDTPGSFHYDCFEFTMQPSINSPVLIANTDPPHYVKKRSTSFEMEKYWIIARRRSFHAIRLIDWYFQYLRRSIDFTYVPCGHLRNNIQFFLTNRRNWTIWFQVCVIRVSGSDSIRFLRIWGSIRLLIIGILIWRWENYFESQQVGWLSRQSELFSRFYAQVIAALLCYGLNAFLGFGGRFGSCELL